MTQEELIQSPDYWKKLYEDACFNIGINPNKVKFSINEDNEDNENDVRLNAQIKSALNWH